MFLAASLSGDAACAVDLIPWMAVAYVITNGFYLRQSTPLNSRSMATSW